MTGELRLAEVMSGLSLSCDAANGNEPGKVIRTATLAVAIGRQHGLGPDELRDAYYVNVLRFLGCTAFAHEETHVYGGGDDIAVRRTMALADAANPGQLVGRVLRGILPSGPITNSTRAVAMLLGDGVAVSRHAHAQCDVGVRMAEILALGPRVMAALRQVCERWDGRGAAFGAEGEALAVAIRLHHIAEVIDLVYTEYGREAALAEAKKRCAQHFDPRLIDSLLSAPEFLLYRTRTVPCRSATADRGIGLRRARTPGW